MKSGLSFIRTKKPGGSEHLKGRRTGFTIRVAVIIQRDGKILLARHFREGRDYWVVPGGRLGSVEGVLECGKREILEETGLRVEISSLVYISEFSGDDFSVLDLFFLGEQAVGEAALGCDPEDAGENSVLKEIRWFSPEEFAEIPLLPAHIKRAIVKDWPHGFRDRGSYIKAGREKG